MTESFAPPQRYAQLVTARQVEVLRLLSLGLTIDAVAARLGVTSHTAATFRRALYRKLRVTNVAEAVRVGFELGLLTARPTAPALNQAVG